VVPEQQSFSINGLAQFLPISGSASLVQVSSWCQRHVHVHLHGVEVGNVDVGVVVVVLVVVVVPIVVVAVQVVGHVDGGVHHREHEAQESNRRQLTNNIRIGLRLRDRGLRRYFLTFREHRRRFHRQPV
jgi:hypothetical protein